MTGYEKNMRAIQDFEAKHTGKPNMRGAEDMRQLKVLAKTITHAVCQNDQTTDDFTSICEEIHHLSIAASNELHRLKTTLGMEAPNR